MPTVQEGPAQSYGYNAFGRGSVLISQASECLLVWSSFVGDARTRLLQELLFLWSPLFLLLSLFTGDRGSSLPVDITAAPAAAEAVSATLFYSSDSGRSMASSGRIKSDDTERLMPGRSGSLIAEVS